MKKLKITHAVKQAIARELVYDLIISEIETGSVNEAKMRNILDIPSEDSDGNPIFIDISDDDVIEVTERMGSLASYILRQRDARMARGRYTLV